MEPHYVDARSSHTGALPAPDGVEAFLGSGGMAGLLFTASWCAAGVLLERQFMDTASTTKVPLVVVDCEVHPHLADRFQVRSLPTFILMRAEREEGRLLGAFSVDQVRTLLERPARERTAAKTVTSAKIAGKSVPAPARVAPMSPSAATSLTVSPVSTDPVPLGGPS